MKAPPPTFPNDLRFHHRTGHVFRYRQFNVFLVVCRLSGLSPFMGDNDGETLCNVIKGEYDFNYAEFDDVSEEAKEVIRNLLIGDKRLVDLTRLLGRYIFIKTYTQSLTLSYPNNITYIIYNLLMSRQKKKNHLFKGKLVLTY